MKFSSEPTPRGPIFCGQFDMSRLKFSSEIKNFDRDRNFRSRSIFFDRWALWELLAITIKKKLAVLRGKKKRPYCGLAGDKDVYRKSIESNLKYGWFTRKVANQI